MMAPRAGLDPRATPPVELRDLFKTYSKMKLEDIAHDPEIIDFTSLGIKFLQCIPPARLKQLFESFLSERDERGSETGSLSSEPQASVYASETIPGLFVLPSLFPIVVQEEMLRRLMGQSLSNPDHNTNLHLHYEIEYPRDGRSFFCEHPSTVMFRAKDPSVHRDLTVKDVLDRKLRWITLGGQYDWTDKSYPDTKPPPFPEGLGRLIGGLFPGMEPQAAIVNLYSPGNTLSLHRDVSEEVDCGLVSVSLGCDGLFIIALENEDDSQPLSSPRWNYNVLRLRSGDAVYMSGEARYAWHGVPKIIAGTCPKELADWPGDNKQDWKDWMSSKRINVNVRQMRLSPADLCAESTRRSEQVIS